MQRIYTDRISLTCNNKHKLLSLWGHPACKSLVSLRSQPKAEANKSQLDKLFQQR